MDRTTCYENEKQHQARNRGRDKEEKDSSIPLEFILIPSMLLEMNIDSIISFISRHRNFVNKYLQSRRN